MRTFDSTQQDSEAPAVLRPWNIAVGLVVILFGVVLLAGNLGIGLPWTLPHNGGALFILVGTAAQAGQAWNRWRAVGAIDGVVAHRMLSALATLTVALVFLLDVSFATWWPVFVIIGGLHAMLPRRGRAERVRGR